MADSDAARVEKERAERAARKKHTEKACFVMSNRFLSTEKKHGYRRLWWNYH